MNDAHGGVWCFTIVAAVGVLQETSAHVESLGVMALDAASADRVVLNTMKNWCEQ